MLKHRALRVHVSHSELRNNFTIPVLVKMNKSANYPSMKTVKKMSEIFKALDRTFKVSQDAYVGLVKAYANLDEHGNIVEQEGKPGSFVIPTEKTEEWQTSLGKFMDTKLELELPYGKMTLDEVAKVGLSPEDLGAVSFIVE